jgi:predicted DNA-binding transcriptional regulator AlpA
MTTTDKPSSDLKDPSNPLLDCEGLAALLGISPASIASIRSRSPQRLPPPYLGRPLRWRRETVLSWMSAQEAKAQQRAEQGAPPEPTALRARQRTTPVRQVCMENWGPATSGRLLATSGRLLAMRPIGQVQPSRFGGQPTTGFGLRASPNRAGSARRFGQRRMTGSAA